MLSIARFGSDGDSGGALGESGWVIEKRFSLGQWSW
jgi:hypothetical protein